MKTIYINIWILLALINPIFGQGSGYLNTYKDVPREKVFVSFNNSLLFTGEYLMYKIYVLNDKTKQPSKISTIAYVELIGEGRERVFSHKIRLENSQGQGDFFIPTSIPSGNYKLIAYTRWMRNGNVNLFFQEDLSILNPYQSNQDQILTSISPTDLKSTKQYDEEERFTQDKRFVLITDREKYGKKSKVVISLKNFRGASGYGNYTISVRKKDFLNGHFKDTPESYIASYDKLAPKPLFYDTIKFTPETAGEQIKGRLVSRIKDRSIANQKVAMSIPGDDFQLKVVSTDSTGAFIFNISKDYTTPYAVFQVLDDLGSSYNIKIEEDSLINYDNLEFQNFYISKEMQEAIIQRSVYNQIENRFFSVKPDTVDIGQINDPYGGAYIETVNLGDYTRFKTLEETIVEIVPNVWTKKIDNDTSVFKVRSFDEAYEESEYDALVFIDGIFMPNPNKLLDFDTRIVNSINTVRQKYRIGGKYYFGMVNILTKEGNYYDLLNDTTLTKISLKRPRPKKGYFKQSYEYGTSRRIPDFRYQLLWKPTIEFEDKEMELNFYTSSVSGEYEALLEGFSIYGRPVAMKKTFYVE